LAQPAAPVAAATPLTVPSPGRAQVAAPVAPTMPAPAASGAFAGAPFADASSAVAQRDPFQLTPRLQAGSGGMGGFGFVQLLRPSGMPAVRLKALIDSPNGRIALVDVQDVGQFRVREGENIQLSPTVGMRVQHIGREELVLTPMDVRTGINQLIIK
ncbi:MAG TPA: hypothetical protein VGC24_07195, partial [Burkholderiaceae bacterium]